MTVLEPERVNNRRPHEPRERDEADADELADGYDKDTVLFGDGRSG